MKLLTFISNTFFAKNLTRAQTCDSSTIVLVHFFMYQWRLQVAVERDVWHHSSKNTCEHCNGIIQCYDDVLSWPASTYRAFRPLGRVLGE